jgi:hypothetical protein
VNVRAGTVARPLAEKAGSVDPEGPIAEEVARLLGEVHRALHDEYFRQANGTALARLFPYMPLLREVARQPGITVNELALWDANIPSRVNQPLGPVVGWPQAYRAPKQPAPDPSSSALYIQ